VDPDGGWDGGPTGMDPEHNNYLGFGDKTNLQGTTVTATRLNPFFLFDGRPSSAYLFPGYVSVGNVGYDLNKVMAASIEIVRSELANVGAGVNMPDDWFFNKYTGEVKWFEGGYKNTGIGNAGKNWSWTGVSDQSFGGYLTASNFRDAQFSNNAPRYKTEIPEGNEQTWLARSTIATHQIDYKRDPSYLYDFAGAAPHWLTFTVESLFAGEAVIELGFAGYYGLGRWMTSGSPFSLNGGYGLFGREGLTVGGYKIEALYANPRVGLGAGTIFSIKQTVKNGSLFRLDYGILHTPAQEMGLHWTYRFYLRGQQFGAGSRQYYFLKPWVRIR
jgi:hypothetical protein